MLVTQGGHDFSSYFQFESTYVKGAFFNSDLMLQTKIRINEQYRTNPRSIVEHTMNCLALNGQERVLDMGCGVGYILEAVTPLLTTGSAHGFDISPQLLKKAEERLASIGRSEYATLEVRDASELQDITSSAYDRIIANFMIHYVRDLKATLQQIARILQPTGRFVLSTDSTATMSEMYRAHFDSMAELGFPRRLFQASPKARICLENGSEQLLEFFKEVDLVTYEDALEFHEPGPFMEFYMVGHKFCCANAVGADDLPPERFEALAATVAARVQHVIDTHGVFRVSKRAGSFVCTGPKI